MEDNEIEVLWNDFVRLLRSTKREGIEELITWLDNSDFKYAPASTKYHNAKRGGLLQHSLNVYYIMLDLKPLTGFLEIPEDTMIITGLLHDICKTYYYVTDYRNTKNPEGEWVRVPYYTVKDSFPYGHGEKSVSLAQNFIKLTSKEKMMIRYHMAFSRDEASEVSQAYSLFPECLLVSFSDQISTYIMESNEIREDIQAKLLGKNLTECLEKLSIKDINNSEVIINGQTYELAPKDAVVDDKEVIEIISNGCKIKVYSPYKDGLPF